MTYAADFVGLLLKQTGDPYRYGAEVDLDAEDPAGPWDCSELVQWGCHRLGVVMPDGSANQLSYCSGAGTLITIDEGLETQGALLFRQRGADRHVAVSLGNHSTIEARGARYGVGSWLAGGRVWTHAARIPTLEYVEPPAAPAPADAPATAGSEVPAWHGRYFRQPPPSIGMDVAQWQVQMKGRGWRVEVDGIYGPKSAEACRRFQREKGLRVDGVVGPDTWRAAWAAPIT